jgi:hypothetical protein
VKLSVKNFCILAIATLISAQSFAGLNNVTLGKLETNMPEDVALDVEYGITEAGADSFLKGRDAEVSSLMFDYLNNQLTVTMIFNGNLESECTIDDINSPQSIMDKMGIRYDVAQALETCFTEHKRN